MTDDAAEARAKAAGLITACWSTQVIGVAAKLRLFDLMAAGARTSPDLADQTGSNEQALHRLMRALAALGLCRQTAETGFELTAAGRLLCDGVPGSVRGMALHWGDRLWGALSQLDRSVATGEAWSISGLEGFEHMVRDPDQMAMFHQSMADQTLPMARALIEACDFSRFGRIIDVGGSYGALLAEILKAHPALQGQVFDLPELKDAADALFAREGLTGRAGFVGGSFFDGAPPGADAYLMKTVIHDWYDDRAAAILASCRKALPEGGVVLVVERVAPDLATESRADLQTIRTDMLMLTAAGGMERTRAQFEALFTRAGLRLDRVVPTASEFSVLEARLA